MPKITLLLPAYNEEQELELLLKQIKRCQEIYSWDLKVVGINDGSVDNTLAIFESSKEYLDCDIINKDVIVTIATVFTTALVKN